MDHTFLQMFSEIRRMLLQVLRNQQGELEIQRSIMYRPRNIGLYSDEERNALCERETRTKTLIEELQK